MIEQHIPSRDPVVITSDETYVNFDGHFNKQNCRFWRKKKPKELPKKPLHSQKVTYLPHILTVFAP